MIFDHETEILSVTIFLKGVITSKNKEKYDKILDEILSNRVNIYSIQEDKDEDEDTRESIKIYQDEIDRLEKELENIIINGDDDIPKIYNARTINPKITMKALLSINDLDICHY